MRLHLPLVFCCALCHLALASSDWPRFRGPNGNGASPETGINKDWKAKPPKELWRIALGDGGYAGPSVAAGKLFIIDKAGKEEVVRAVDLKTGKDAWSFKYPDSYNSGNPQWGNGRSTPTYDNGKLYTQGAAGLVHCLDAEKGTKIWSRDNKADFGGRARKDWWGYTPAPVIDGERVIICPGGPGAALVALDKNTGKEIWKGGGDDQAGYATPVLAAIGGKKQFVSFTGLSVIGVDAASGALLWRHPWQTDYDINAADPIVIGDSVFITSGYGHGCALLNIADGKATVAWENKEMKAHFNSPVLLDGYLYGNSDPGDLVCLEAKTGTAAWRQPRYGKGGVILVDGALIAVNGDNGTVALVKPNPKAYEEIGSIKPLADTGKYWTPPIVADGKLFVRSQKTLACLELK